MIKKESLNKLKINCRSHLEDYKTVIGAVLLRLPGVSTVVNKSSSIDNTFRNFRLAAVLLFYLLCLHGDDHVTMYCQHGAAGGRG